MIKTCLACGIAKPLEGFSKARVPRGERTARGGMGVAARCRQCKSEQRKPGITGAREEAITLLSSAQKRCSKCGVVKSVKQFHERKASPDGLCYKCTECSQKYLKEWKSRNPNSFREWYADNREKRAAYWLEWYGANKVSRAKSYALWAKANKHIVNSIVAKRNATKKKGYPVLGQSKKDQGVL